MTVTVGGNVLPVSEAFKEAVGESTRAWQEKMLKRYG